MDIDALYHSPDMAQFYDIDNGARGDLDACRALAAGRSSILDLGCGSGLFAAALAQEGGRAVTGVDPARAMLDIARGRPGGERVDWVEGDARTVRLGRTFDLVVLTGHAFQVFLDEEAQGAVLRTIAAHLAPQGRFVFDTRNPAAQEWTEWTEAQSRRSFDHPAFGEVLAWNDVALDPATGVVTYGTHYQVASSGLRHSAYSRIAFPLQDRLAAMMDDAGLVVEAWLGDWSGAPYAPTAPEIIPIGRLR